MLQQAVVLDPAGIDRLLGSQPIPADDLVSTDDNLRLEYGTPKGNVLDSEQSANELQQFLLRYRTRQ